MWMKPEASCHNCPSVKQPPGLILEESFLHWESHLDRAPRSCAAKASASTWTLRPRSPEDGIAAKRRFDSHKLTTRAAILVLIPEAEPLPMCSVEGGFGLGGGFSGR